MVALTPDVDRESARIDALRTAAETDLTAFATLTMRGYVASWHHREIARALDEVVRGACKRLIITMPPRHGKTELATVRFAPWLFTRRPKAKVIAATYAGEYADELGRKARSVLESPTYRGLWPASRLALGNRAVSRWETVSGGGYYAIGVGGALTGRGADVLLIDDPHKNREEAESKLNRDRVWDWYRSTAFTRLEKGGAVVIVMTRWHCDDLVARCLALGDEWKVLSLPAIAEVDEPFRKVGEALWPGKYDTDALAQIRATVGEREWSALYQQRPAPLEGNLFKPDQLVLIDAEPAGVKWVRCWDFGATQGAGDWTVGVKLGQKDGRTTVADVVRLRGSPEEVERALVATASRDGTGVTIGLPQDPGQAGKAQVQYLTRQLSGYTVRSSPESGDKALRAEPFASQVNVGNVSLVRGAWNLAFMDELRVFPNGQHDDQVDAASRAFFECAGNANTAIIEYLRGLRAQLKAK